MSDLVITIKENSSLYNELKKQNLLENENELLEKLDYIFYFANLLNVDDDLYGYEKPEFYEKSLNGLKGKKLKKEIINKLVWIKNSIDGVIERIEEAFGKVNLMEDSRYVFVNEFCDITNLKYMAMILPVIINKMKDGIKDSRENEK